jgi:predicted nucleotidyltransferase
VRLDDPGLTSIKSPNVGNAPTLAEIAFEHFDSLRILYICNMTLDSTKIESIKNYFKTRPVLKAYLFGSYVRGAADNKSDIDILVDLDYSQKIGLQFIQMKLDLEKLLNNKVDLVSSNGMSKYIRPLVDSEKRLIYAK